MKIVAWNCKMAFRKKAAFVLSYQPDIVIVPECEHPDKLKFGSGVPLPRDVVWHGDNTNKGLGVFSYGAYKLQLLDVHNPDLRMILPLRVAKADFDFILFAIWANNPLERKYQYVGQIWKAIHHYDELLQREKTILAGDFNSSSIWDKPRREFNHTNVVERLEQKRIYSAYHRFHNQKQGAEAHPTWYMYHREENPYHLDYCFASRYFIEKLKGCEIGAYRQWSKLSDHMPVIVDFEE